MRRFYTNLFIRETYERLVFPHVLHNNLCGVPLAITTIGNLIWQPNEDVIDLVALSLLQKLRDQSPVILALLDCNRHHLILDVDKVLQELLQCMLLEEEDVTLLICLGSRLSDALPEEEAVAVSEVGALHDQVERYVKSLLIIIKGVWGLLGLLLGVLVDADRSLPTLNIIGGLVKVWVNVWIVKVHMQDDGAFQDEVD